MELCLTIARRSCYCTNTVLIAQTPKSSEGRILVPRFSVSFGHVVGETSQHLKKSVALGTRMRGSLLTVLFTGGHCRFLKVQNCNIVSRIFNVALKIVSCKIPLPQQCYELSIFLARSSGIKVTPSCQSTTKEHIVNSWQTNCAFATTITDKMQNKEINKECSVKAFAVFIWSYFCYGYILVSWEFEACLQDAWPHNVLRLQEYIFPFRTWKVWNVGGAIPL